MKTTCRELVQNFGGRSIKASVNSLIADPAVNIWETTSPNIVATCLHQKRGLYIDIEIEDVQYRSVSFPVRTGIIRKVLDKE